MATSIARIVLSAVDQTSAAFKTAQAGLADLQRRASSVGTVFSALGPQIAAAVSVGGISAFVRSTVNAIDALNDAADATGSTIEQLSSLENVARRNGGTLDDVTGILVKFNQALAGADGKNGISQALQAIGLDARDLRNLDPADALERVAVALAGFADDGNKARLVQELFGKSIRDAAPFLKDLAEQGRQNATVTAEQAKAAEEFNKQLAAISTNAGNAGRALVSGLLPRLNEVLVRFEALKLIDASPLKALASSALNSQFINAADGVKFYTDRVNGLRETVAKLERGGSPFDRLNVAPRREELAEAERFLAFYRQVARQTSQLDVPQASYSNEGRNAIRRLPALPGSAAPGRPAAAPPAARGLRDMVPGLVEDRELVKLAAELTSELGKLAALDDLPFVQDIDRLNKLLAATPTSELERTREDMQLLTAAFTEGRLSVEAYTEAVQTRLGTLPQVAGPALEQISEFAKQAERNIQNALGDTLKRTLTGDFKSIGQLWRNLLIDMAAQALAADLGRKLFPNGAAGGGSIFSAIFSLLGFAKGGAFAGGKVVPFASGGLVNGPTLFPMAGGLGLMGEAGPEAIVPLRRGRDGRLGVAGGGTVVNNVYNVAAGVSRNELVTALQLMQQSIEGRMVSMMRRQGTA